MTRRIGDFCRHPKHPPDCRVILSYPTQCWYCPKRVILYQCERAGPVVLEPPDKGAHIPTHCGNPPENEGDTPLSPLIYPARDGDAGQINKLGQSPNIIARWIDWEGKDGRTALSVAAGNGHAEAIEALVTLGENPNHLAANGLTPIFHAAMNNRPEAIKTLARLGGDHRHLDNGQRSVLDWAMRVNAPESVVALAQLAKQDFLRAAMRALIPALSPNERFDRTDTIMALHALGANHEEPDENGCRPIHLAAKAGSWTAAGALARCGVGLEAKCNMGFTPMHWAAHGNYAKVIAVLNERGALVNSQTHDGETPLDWADKKNNGHAIRELESRGGKRKGEL